MALLDFDMGLNASMFNRMAELGRARDGFTAWLKQNPQYATAYLGTEGKKSLDQRQLFIPITDFTTARSAYEIAAACRAQRLGVAHDKDKRTHNVLRYAACKKLIWFARGQPKA